MDMDFLTLIKHASLVGKAVILILICMSITSIGMIFQKWFSINKATAKTLHGLSTFGQAKDLRTAILTLGADPTSPLYSIANEGVTEFNLSKDMGNAENVIVDNVRRSLRQGVGKENGKLSSSISFLATAANTAPFIGLLGTVWGIMETFHAIGAMKSASLATVAPGISEALIATAFGLFVAIPATIGYNTFQGRLDTLESLLVNFASMFLNRVQRELNATQPSA